MVLGEELFGALGVAPHDVSMRGVVGFLFRGLGDGCCHRGGFALLRYRGAWSFDRHNHFDHGYLWCSLLRDYVEASELRFVTFLLNPTDDANCRSEKD